MDRTDDKKAPPSGSTVHDDSDTSCYATEDEEDTQIHLGPKISIKEHLEKDKDDESLRKWKEQLLGSVDVSQVEEVQEPEVKILNLIIVSAGRPDIILEIPDFGNPKGLWSKPGTRVKKDIWLGDLKAAEIEILNVFQLLTAKPVVYLWSMRLDVPKFSGGNPESWIFAIKEYFSLLNTLVYQRLRIARFNLEGAVAEWFWWMTRNGLITIGTDILESFLISFYVSRLKLHLQRELLVSRPATLGDVFALAQITEARLEDQAAPTTVNTAKPPLLPKPMGPSKLFAIKWISPAERQERFNKGLCFNCDNQCERGKKCSGKFLLLTTDEEDDPGATTIEEGDNAVESGDILILNSLIGYGSLRSL
uniref:Rho GDP-dissociation inhibitor 1-like n=1 Tax=Tanacetum cinerariifolium TaxID=118510 RepID=A0A6L2NAF9_TANCI|nr:Rho GDP-dissociation inhibitor 1-like [Tanacetum cinerariifolium]